MELKSTARRRAGEAGFLMGGGVIAAALLLVIAIGVIPPFPPSMVNNALGSDYTQATAHGITGLERARTNPSRAWTCCRPRALRACSAFNTWGRECRAGARSPIR